MASPAGDLGPKYDNERHSGAWLIKMPLLDYSPLHETQRVFDLLCGLKDELCLPSDTEAIAKDVVFTSEKDTVYFPIPLKETETSSALKGIEALVAASLANLKYGTRARKIDINLEHATCFLFQAYVSTIDGLGKYDEGSNPYRRMSANLYATKTPGAYYHIHGSLEATKTLGMIGLPPYRPDLKTIDDIAQEIESHVQQFTIEELEQKNKELGQAGVIALKHEDFIATPHGKANVGRPPWSLKNLESTTPPVPLPTDPAGTKPRVLQGIKVIELCRVIAGPVMGRILAEYGAEVLKVTGPNLPDVPFFQIDVNMGKRTTDIDLKSEEGRAKFEELLADADIILDGYRPGTFEKLGYGPEALSRLAVKRGKGYVYVNENCFGYEGEWAYRPGWQQIADCVSGVAWAQGKFMGLNEPVVPPFPISDYGTGAMGAIAALTGLYHRATKGGSWHGRASLMQYDLLLFSVGQYDEKIQDELRSRQEESFFALRHQHSVDQISGTVMKTMQKQHPHLFTQHRETWRSHGFNADVSVITPVAKIEGVEVSFQRASAPNGTYAPAWEFHKNEDVKLSDS
ncbi:CAIB/BAIF family protein enzyme [Coccidioides immitis RMSCC 2394]|uniref:CAIB/BAIF family protein enzyme n=1 Tax=Coccidioides immitis RMSCC 2394 TaxID=404692 RepID=A0A0J6Y0P6_COCIT|nr:CAIB/BAIF family protein enzyme [Coccidioides immitis RMSCC 2394]